MRLANCGLRFLVRLKLTRFYEFFDGANCGATFSFRTKFPPRYSLENAVCGLRFLVRLKLTRFYGFFDGVNCGATFSFRTKFPPRYSLENAVCGLRFLVRLKLARFYGFLSIVCRFLLGLPHPNPKQKKDSHQAVGVFFLSLYRLLIKDRVCDR